MADYPTYDGLGNIVISAPGFTDDEVGYPTQDKTGTTIIGAPGFTPPGVGYPTYDGLGNIIIDADLAPFTPTIALEPTDNRVFQRTTTTGGGLGKGQGSVDYTISLPQSSDLWVRVRDAISGATLQKFRAIENAPSGSSARTISGIDARLGHFYLDFAGASGGPWALGANKIAMGRGVCAWGQSQMVRFFGKMPVDSDTIASLGVSVNDNGWVYATYSDGLRSVSAPAWSKPVTGGSYDSTAAAVFLNKQVTEYGVTCFLTGHAVGSTTVADWQDGQTAFEALEDRVQEVGGFEAAYGHIGGTDAGNGTTEADYKTRLSAIYSALTPFNLVRGSAYSIIHCAMATRLSGGAGTAAQVTAIRKASKDWCAANGAGYREPHFVELISGDAVHQGNRGNVMLAEDAHRGFVEIEGRVTNAAAPVILSGVRSGADITLTASLSANASALVEDGDASGRFKVYTSGTSTAHTVSNVAVSVNLITVTLSPAPSDSTALDVFWLYHPDPNGSTADENMIFDNYNPESNSAGRQLAPTHVTIVIAAPSPAPSGASDTFTDSNGVATGSHTADTGQSWTVYSGSADVQSNALRNITAPTVLGFNYTPSDPNYNVSAVFKCITMISAQSTYLCARLQDGNNFYLAGHRWGTGWVVSKMIGGSYTELATAGATALTDGQNYDVEFRLSGTSLKLFVGGVEIISVTDNAITTAGKPGVRWSGNSSGGNTGTHIDSITITE